MSGLHPFDDPSKHGPLLQTHLNMCESLTQSLEECLNNKSATECKQTVLEHMECVIAKREYAMNVATHLVGAAQVEKTFPYYQESMAKAKSLLAVAKGTDGASSDFDAPVWKPAV